MSLSLSPHYFIPHIFLPIISYPIFHYFPPSISFLPSTLHCSSLLLILLPNAPRVRREVFEDNLLKELRLARPLNVSDPYNLHVPLDQVRYYSPPQSPGPGELLLTTYSPPLYTPGTRLVTPPPCNILTHSPYNLQEMTTFRYPGAKWFTPNTLKNTRHALKTHSSHALTTLFKATQNSHHTVRTIARIQTQLCH